MRVLDHLVKAIRKAAVYNPEIQVAPDCILWPDKEAQWESVLPRLQLEMPELLWLGDYAPEQRKGPAIWLRCALAKQLDGVELPEESTPIIYMPRVSRQDLRAVENCPETLKPLAELQYRGGMWSQVNAKDWTILAFLKSDQGGLGLDVAQDQETKRAMQLALYRLLDVEMSLLRDKHLEKDYFNTMLTGGDPIRELLEWLDRGDAFKAERDDNAWQGLVELWRSQLHFDPDAEGILSGNAKLASREGPWEQVWERFCEAPGTYVNIPKHIRKSSPPSEGMLLGTDEAGMYDGWPQWNDSMETQLRQELTALGQCSIPESQKRIAQLELAHARRRSLPWATLGEAPLAQSLAHLSVLATQVSHRLVAGDITDLEAGYQENGWKADDAVIGALSHIRKQEDLAAVSEAVRVLYLPWAEESARYLQELAYDTTYPRPCHEAIKAPQYKEGDCVLFVDGLRFDVAKRLVATLHRGGMTVAESCVWAALPSVTATAKAAITPVCEAITGAEASVDFEPMVAATGQSLKGGGALKRLLADAGWKVLSTQENGEGKGRAWCEMGDIDKTGHAQGWKLARRFDEILDDISVRISSLLEAGWQRVFVVTDHGWLLLPGGLPKTELPSVLSEQKWGRCALLKDGAITDERLYPWYWNPHQHVAMASGISCYKQGAVYAHGGLSLQECLLLHLTVSRDNAGPAGSAVKITDLGWKGLRCNVAVEGTFTGLQVDIRAQAGDPASSLVMSPKPFKKGGISSVVVPDESDEGKEAILVVVDAQENLVAQQRVVIGGVT